MRICSVWRAIAPLHKPTVAPATIVPSRFASARGRSNAVSNLGPGIVFPACLVLLPNGWTSICRINYGATSTCMSTYHPANIVILDILSLNSNCRSGHKIRPILVKALNCYPGIKYRLSSSQSCLCYVFFLSFLFCTRCLPKGSTIRYKEREK